MVKGTVVEFTMEKGYGRIELEDGQIVIFDAGVMSTFDVKPGDTGEITYRELRNGRKVISRIDFD